MIVHRIYMIGLPMFSKLLFTGLLGLGQNQRILSLLQWYSTLMQYQLHSELQINSQNLTLFNQSKHECIPASCLVGTSVHSPQPYSAASEMGLDIHKDIVNVHRNPTPVRHGPQHRHGQMFSQHKTFILDSNTWIYSVGSEATVR